MITPYAGNGLGTARLLIASGMKYLSIATTDGVAVITRDNAESVTLVSPE